MRPCSRPKEDAAEVLVLREVEQQSIAHKALEVLAEVDVVEVEACRGAVSHKSEFKACGLSDRERGVWRSLATGWREMVP